MATMSTPETPRIKHRGMATVRREGVMDLDATKGGMS